MGPICDLCDEGLGWGAKPHVCDPAKIKANVERLDLAARTAESRLEEIRNAVFMLLEPLPAEGVNSLECDEITVKTEWLRKLWQSAQCQWYEAKSMDGFLARWMALHRILCESFDLFRSKKYGKVETKLEKLKALKESVEHAQKVLNYKNSKLDLTPEDLVNG